MKKSIVLLLIFTMVVSTFLIGCAPKEPAVVEPGTETPVAKLPGAERGNVLTVGGTSPQGIFNPLTSSTAYDRYIYDLIFTYLLEVEPSGALTTDGSLTKEYTVSEDGLVYTFKLREGIKWHDGTDVTADDVVFSYNAIFAPDYKGRLYIAECKVSLVLTM